MKIFSQDQIYKGDKLTAEKQNITSTELMERAGTKIFDWIHARLKGAPVPIHVFCGIGNNGGDGLVIARHLINHGYNTYVYIVNYSDKRSKDFLINYDRIKNTSKTWPELMTNAEDLPQIGSDDIVIDAVFGIGLNRPPADWVIELFKHIRESGAFTLSVDIPSGLCDDQPPINEDAAIWADHTLSFQAPKLSFFLPSTAKHTKQWDVLDIGIDREFLNETETVAELIGKYEALSLYKPRDKFSHKGTHGHAMIIGGSKGKMGAVVLSIKGCLVAGAGLVTAYIPKIGYNIVQTAVPEAMTIVDDFEDHIETMDFKLDSDVIAIGPGLGTESKTVTALKKFLESNQKPLIIDADGLNILSKNKDFLKLLPENTILTPHPKELERLIGKWKNDYQKLEKTRAFAKRYKVIVIIKGAHTIVATDKKLYVNTSGNQGLATGGTGDVLTGVVTGLISQGYTPLNAAIFGVYLHGKSADLLLNETGYESMTATDVANNIRMAYLDLFRKPDVANNVEEEKKEKK